MEGKLNQNPGVVKTIVSVCRNVVVFAMALYGCRKENSTTLSGGAVEKPLFRWLLMHTGRNNSGLFGFLGLFLLFLHAFEIFNNDFCFRFHGFGENMHGLFK